MNKTLYKQTLEYQSSKWLKQCHNEPSKFMRPIHLAIIRIVLRHRGEMI